MKMYGRKFARRYMDKRVERRTETRDAILWDIDWVAFKARVKIQGSNEYVIAHFPRNWKKKPYWLKPGNAVSIRHKSGARGYVEVIGEGRAIPAPVSGSALPIVISPTTGDDGVISGLEVHQTEPTATNAVVVEPGTYRIDGVIYTLNPSQSLDYITMADPAPIVMGSRTLMGTGNYTLLLPSSPVSGEHIYYAVTANASGEILLVSGEASSAPEKPDIPTGYILLGDYIFVRGGTGAVTDYYIGAEWKAPAPGTIEITCPDANVNSNFEMDWDAGDNYPTTTIRISVLDQYDTLLPAGAGEYQVTLQMMVGSGSMYDSDSDTWTNGIVTKTFGTTGYTDITYRRDETGTEDSPIFKAILHTEDPLSDILTIVLLDAGGDPI